jgi:hypothetical protein
VLLGVVKRGVSFLLYKVFYVFIGVVVFLTSLVV